jgi:hypothetical protein
MLGEGGRDVLLGWLSRAVEIRRVDQQMEHIGGSWSRRSRELGQLRLTGDPSGEFTGVKSTPENLAGQAVERVLESSFELASQLHAKKR